MKTQVTDKMFLRIKVILFIKAKVLRVTNIDIKGFVKLSMKKSINTNLDVLFCWKSYASKY